MTQLWKLTLASSAIMFAAACGPGPVQMPDASDGPDASMPPADTGANPDATPPPPDAPATCGNAVPTSNYCSNVGCNVRPFDLTSCDEGNATVPFYSGSYCDPNVRLTLLVVAAGWCAPCMQEAPMIEELITVPYRERGVRVMTVYGQNPNYSTPTVPNCNIWRNRYSLTSEMTIDPMGATQVYFPNMAFPANILINNRGQIVFRQYGTQTGLTDLINAIETALE